MRTAIKAWKRAVLCVLGIGALAITASAFAACWGDSEVVAEYLFFEGEGSTAVNTGIDEDDGNAALVNGSSFNADAPPSNGGCGWSVQLPGTGSGATTPAVETAADYDPFAEASSFTIMAWVRRESESASSNTSARIASDTSSLTLTNTTAGVEFRFAGSTGGLYLRVNGNEVGTTSASVPPNGNEWRHVAVVYDGTRPATNVLTRNAHFYVDGIQRGDGNTLQGVVVGINDNRLTLGNSSVSRGIANLLVGKMDDVIILYDVAPAAVGNGKTSETIRCYMDLNDDIEPPSIDPPGNVTTNTDPGQCSCINVSLGQPTASDNCGVADIENNAPDVFPSGTNFVVWTATDYAGNVGACTQTVTVVDAENPVITSPSNVTVDAGPCLAAITNVSLNEAVATDNCGVTILYSEVPAALPIGTNSVVWHAYDAAGNHASCTQQVVVVPSRTLDCDGDGLTDYEEVATYLTNPQNACTAGDGISDGWKVQYGFDPAVAVPAECKPRVW